MTARTSDFGQRQLPGRVAQHSRSAAARGFGDHHHPRPGPGRAWLRRQRPADPGRHPDLRRDRGRDHLLSDTLHRVAGKRHAHRQWRGPDPARRWHASRRPLDNVRVVGLRDRGRPVTAFQVRHQAPRLECLQPFEHRPRGHLRHPWRFARRAARLLVGSAWPRDAAGLCRDPGRRPAHHPAPASCSCWPRRSGACWLLASAFLPHPVIA